jgi:hypothetical protein
VINAEIINANGIIRACLFSAGNLDLKMPPLDPLVVTNISIQDGAGRPVTISLQLNDVEIYGLSNGHLKTVRLFSSPSDWFSLLRKLLVL